MIAQNNTHENELAARVSQAETSKPKRGRGRPRKEAKPEQHTESREEGWNIPKLGRNKSLAAHRKWQRGEQTVLPRFVLNRKQAQSMLVKFLRSKPGQDALIHLVRKGFGGIDNLPDDKLGMFMTSTNLLSRYPHEIMIQG